jgi:hypothetical protein
VDDCDALRASYSVLPSKWKRVASTCNRVQARTLTGVSRQTPSRYEPADIE